MNKFTEGKPDLDFLTHMRLDLYARSLAHANVCGICDCDRPVLSVLNLAGLGGEDGGTGYAVIGLCGECARKYNDPRYTDEVTAVAERRAEEQLACR